MAILDIGKHKAVVLYGFLDLKKSTLIVEFKSRIKPDPLSALSCSGGLCRRDLYSILDDDQLDRLIEWVKTFDDTQPKTP